MFFFIVEFVFDGACAAHVRLVGACAGHDVAIVVLRGWTFKDY